MIKIQDIKDVLIEVEDTETTYEGTIKIEVDRDGDITIKSRGPYHDAQLTIPPAAAAELATVINLIVGDRK